jgi:undecaprenyl-diphosphatase
VLSTIVVFWKEIMSIVSGVFRFQWNPETRFASLIIVSMIPVGIVGVFFKESVESLFTGNLLLVGFMLLITASLLAISMIIRHKTERPIGYLDALLIGVAQAFAVVPGISRSGATISTGLMLGKNKSEVASFSFLMVLIPIIGANLIDLLKGDFTAEAGVGALPILAGFIAAFVAGFLACKWMVSLIKKGKLIWFAAYCLLAGTIAIVSNFI